MQGQLQALLGMGSGGAPGVPGTYGPGACVVPCAAPAVALAVILNPCVSRRGHASFWGRSTGGVAGEGLEVDPEAPASRGREWTNGVKRTNQGQMKSRPQGPSKDNLWSLRAGQRLPHPTRV